MSLNKPPSEPKELIRRGAADAGGRLSKELVEFQDAERARLVLSQMGTRLSRDLAEAVPGLLAEAPDPDAALILFERLVSESSPEVVRLIERHNFLAHYALVVFGHSRFLGETLIQNTDLLHGFVRENNLDRSFSREEFHEALARFRSRSLETDVALLLARFKRREYIRIMLRDVLKIAPLAETTAEISGLADVLVEEALREADNQLQGRYGMPQHMDAEGRVAPTPFTVLSLGKLGGNELNYSSDVDLLYLFGDGEDVAEAPITNREYFVRLAQKVTEILSRATREGAVFRIDMRLRPQGREGEMAISLSQALRYYAATSQDWECQALIKLRHTAGDLTLARQFIRGVQAHVYVDAAEEASASPVTPPLSQSDVQAEANGTIPDPSLGPGFRRQAPAALTPVTRLNFAAIETALAAREKMHQRKRRSPAESAAHTIDLKMDRGGIRDIEFLVQCLQRVYGGREPWLRSGGTLFSLQKLHDKGHISGNEFHALTEAYEFLRHLEHRLQLRQGQQTHRLPAAGSELRIVWRAMTSHLPGTHSTTDLAAVLQERMAAVAEIYQRVIHDQQNRRYQDAPEAEFRLLSGYEPSAEQSNQQLLQRLAMDAPALRDTASRDDLSPQARRNLFRFLTATFTSSERYAGLLRQAPAVGRALGLFEVSDLLTDILVRHPEEIAALGELGEINSRVGSGYLFDSPLGRVDAVGDPVFSYLANAPSSYGEKLSLLRQHYRHRVFAAGARDIMEARDVYEAMGANTAAAEDAIRAAFGIAGEPAGLAVMALGRLGSGEFDVLSDADLLLVGREGIDLQRLTRAAERMMHALAAYTRDGMVFPVDARLRPRGEEGELVVTPTQLTTYFEQEALPWEGLSYTKLRFLAGDWKSAERAGAATQKLFQRFAADGGFLQAVREMRSRLEVADRTEKSFKSSAGGIYDIDFLSSYLLVKHGVHDKRGSLRDRLWRCAGIGLLAKSDAAVLDHAAELLRTVEHVVRLVMGRARKWLPATEHARQSTQTLTSRILRCEFPHGLEAELLRTLAEVRQLYERVMY